MTGAGYNVVIHEFAHKIHMLREDDDGYPMPFPGMDEKRWRDTLEESFLRLCGEVDAGIETLVDPYAAENPAEFFAVMSELFFTDSAVLARDWAGLYRELALFYRQDPARVLPDRVADSG
jgi:Mlc titration factor MtfA (ptsG expression regulator)